MADLGRICASDRHPWPTGVRFHPTDEELVISFLKKKTCGLQLDSDFVSEIDVYSFEPEDLPGFFFSPRAPNYRNKAKTNRATKHGYWKSTGKIVTVTSKSRNVGSRRTLVFYKKDGSNRVRTDWVMYEYTMSENELLGCNNVQGYYSVYKVKNKSGCGLKNGEQYEAAVNEEHPVDNGSVDREVLFPGSDACANHLPQVGGPEQSVSTVADIHLPDHSRPSIEASGSEQQPSSAPESFDIDFTDLEVSQLATYLISKAKSSPYFSKLASSSEGDFLEITDLGLKIHSDTENPLGSGNLQSDDMNALGISLDDLGDFEYGTVPNPLENENVNDVVNPMDDQFQSNPGFENAGQMDDQMVMHNPATNGFGLSGLQPTSGVLCESSNFVAETLQNEVVEDRGFFARIHSVLWDFVESVPSTPASASENGSVNQTLDQAPSPSSSVSTKTTTTSALDSSSLMSRRRVGSFLFYVLGALCAILWVLIAAVRLWRKCISF